jgi:hypothetical protein
MHSLLTAVLCLGVLGTVASAETPLDKNQAVVRKFEDEFKNKANHAIVDQVMAPGFQAHGLGPAALDREGLKMLGKGVVGAFPTSRR